MSDTIEQLRARLAEAEEERDALRALVGVLPVGVTTFSTDGRVVAHNPAVAKLGLYPPDTIPDASLEQLAALTGHDPQAYRQWWEHLPEGHTLLPILQIPRASGGQSHVRIQVFRSGGRVHLISDDVTDAHEMLARLQDSEERLRRFFAASVEGIIFRHGPWITDANEAAAQMLGTTVEALRGRPILDLVAPGERARGMRLMAQAPERYRIRACRDDGSTFPVEVHAKQIGTEEGRRVLCFLDLTAQERAEASQRERKALVEALSRAAPVALIRLSRDSECRYTNTAWTALTGLSSEAALGDGWWQAVPDSDRPVCKGLLAACRLTRAPTAREYRVLGPEGDERWVFGQFAPLIDDRKDLIGFVGTLTDITDRKTAEQERARTLTQKELLLQEIHHRVKNNLMLVSSLLLLQAQEFTDPVLRDIFSASQARIKAMALLHSNLYATTAVDRVSFDTYTTRLVRSLVDSIGRPDVQVHVDVSLRGEDDLNIQQAIPCGLIINELLTNAFKHAFPPGRPGNIWLRVWRDGPQRVLRVRDDGVGQDGTAHASLGTRLIEMLTQQLGGTLSVTAPPDGGTQTDLRF